MHDSTTILGLFAKWPSAGSVKTRLARDTSPEFAAQVAGAFLRDSLIRFGDLPVERIVVFDPPGAADGFSALVGGRWRLQPQAVGDLGIRLNQFFGDAFLGKSARVVAVGSDSPTLPLDYVMQAFDRLRQCDVVLGPAMDGGYYLIGLSRPAPELFDGIRWSTSNVLGQTVERLGSLSLSLLPPWFDVDTRDDWIAFRGHLKAMRAAGQEPNAAHTEQLMVLGDTVSAS